MESPAWRIEGNPEIIFWPKITLEVEGQPMTLDFLVKYKKDNWVHWLALELDEGGRPTPESLQRERKLKMPVLRVNDEELYHEDFIARLIRLIEAKLAPLGPGEPETPEAQAHLNRAHRRAQRESRKQRVRQRLTPWCSMN